MFWQGWYQYAGLHFVISTTSANGKSNGLSITGHTWGSVSHWWHIRTEHEANLHQIFDRIREHGVKLKKSKCSFFQNGWIFVTFHFQWGCQTYPEPYQVSRMPQLLRTDKNYRNAKYYTMPNSSHTLNLQYQQYAHTYTLK